MSRFSGRQHRGAARQEQTRRTAAAINRQLAAAKREHTDTTEPEQDCS